MGVGSIIVTSFRVFPLLPIRLQWISRISEFEWNHYFTDVQEQGPFRGWKHRHEFVREMREGTDGTIVRDCVEYHVGFGILGTIAEALFVEPMMRHTFAKRQKALRNLLA